MIRVLFWASVLMIIYVYFGYPILIYILSLFYKKPLGGKYIYPMVSIVMSAYNEEKNIERKIQSLQSLDYPLERMEILIGSDGSTDRTDEIALRYINDRFKLFRQQERQGKPSMLNLLVPQAKGEILIFTDARQVLDANALKEIVKHFADLKVGSVSAALFYEREGENKTGSGIGLYWKYEKFIRKSESRMGSMLGATGALYAIRRELFPPLPKDLILDDVYVPMKIVEKGYRAIFDKKAKVYDKVFSNPRDEFLRRARTLAGNYQLFFYLGHLFNPLKGKISWQFFSHKFLRLIVPFLLFIIFLTNMLILRNILYQSIFVLQVTFYIFAFLGLVSKHRNRLFDIPYMFCVMNAAAVVGLYRLLWRKQDAKWEKAAGPNE
jgi:poly-beta-1,6-N-acetyl-D-glucosamine synthase